MTENCKILQALIAENERQIKLRQLTIKALTKRINEKMKEIDQRQIEIQKLKNNYHENKN